MKTRHLPGIVVAMMIVFLLGTSAHATHLRFNIMYNQPHPLSQEVFEPWAEKVEEVTEGRVRVTMFYANALYSPRDGLDAVSSRIADVGIIMPAYTRDRMLMNSVLDLPMVADEKAVNNSEVLWELFQSVPEMQEELKDVKILWTYMNPAFQLHFTKEPVESLEDLQGRVISAGGPTQVQILRRLGASPETMPMVEVFTAMQTGVVEGCILPYAPLRTQGIADLVEYHTHADLMATAFFIGINKRVWNGISGEDQAAIEKISGITAARDSGLTFDRAQVRDTDWMAEKGDEFYTLSPEEREAWAEQIVPIRETWIEDAENKGYDNAREVLQKALELIEEKRQQ